MVQRAKQKRKTCLTCGNPPVARGLCRTCRAASKAAILRGEVTEEQLIEDGLLLPPQNGGRKPNSGFARKLEAIKG